MKVLVGGGRGFIGSAVCRLLQKRGHDWTIISRTSGPKTISWSELKKNGLQECDAIINLSGENAYNPMKRWNEGFKKEVISSRVEITSDIAKLISEANNPPKVFVSASAVGYYAPSTTVEYTEESPPGNDFFARLSVDWENAAKLAESNETRVAIVRIGVVLGKDGGAIQQMKLPFLIGVGGVIGSGDQFFPWIHVDDAAGIFVHAVENNQVKGILNGTAPGVTTNRDFTKAYASALWRPSIFPVPGFVIKMMVGSERASLVLEGQNVQPKRTLDSGYEFKYTNLADALKNIVG
ncbi:epimerase family protein SDR39U1-like [Anneissia japonica]|uniref:epimerase family protein SDR39U1-like n=1 Tax=Anneissia japonica TaxID=1529436 RepID=UPI0014258068|nr:epimerase family protein SDR39U1-like [Anneissia japonica]